MEDLGNLMQGFAVALSLKNLALMFAGVILGVIIGVLPGLGGANGVAILLPLTFGMSQVPGGTTSAISGQTSRSERPAHEHPGQVSTQRRDRAT